MATIKSYTDIEQSKKLAKILPLESADAHWYDNTLGMGYDQEAKDFYDTSNITYIAAWSLAALLDVLPNGIVMNKDSQNDRYHFSSTYVGTYVTADNPVDACVEIIIRLHEMNLL